MKDKKYVQRATVWLDGDNKPYPMLRYVSSDLKKAHEWVLAHDGRLEPGQRYDIYYRCEVKEGDGCGGESYVSP